MQFANNKTFRCALGGLALLMLTGCGASKNVVYLQDATPDQIVRVAEEHRIKVAPGDEIMVYVSCEDPETSARLSLMAGARRPEPTASGVSVASNQTILPYLVDKKGDIEMPLIGDIKVSGLTRREIAEKIRNEVVAHKLAKPGTVNVTVQFANLSFSAMGEVARPGDYRINDDDVTLLEAISQAGDLTIYGRRDAVWVIREMPDGERKLFKVDLRDKSFLESPAYYVQQNDVIYVEPNGVRAGQSTLNENTFKSVGFWTSLVSVAVSVATLIVTLTR